MNGSQWLPGTIDKVLLKHSSLVCKMISCDVKRKNVDKVKSVSSLVFASILSFYNGENGCSRKVALSKS